MTVVGRSAALTSSEELVARQVYRNPMIRKYIGEPPRID
jgi:hypothetical protein